MQKPPCDEVNKIQYCRYRSVILTLNPPLTAALQKGDCEQTFARCTSKSWPSHDIVRLEYLPESSRLCKIGLRSANPMLDVTIFDTGV
jgi:hypothetical protein